MLGINKKIIVSITHFLVVERTYFFFYKLKQVSLQIHLIKLSLKFTQYITNIIKILEDLQL